MLRIYVILLSAFLAGLYYASVTCEVYSSVAQLTKMVETIKKEDPLMKYLNKFVKKLDKHEEHLKKLASYVEELEALSAGIRDPEFDSKHPLDAYKFIRNHSIVYNQTMTKLIDTVNKGKSVKFSDKVLKQVEKLYPTTEDFAGILEGIYRIIETYEIDPVDLIHGELGGIKTTPLTAIECQELMQISMKHQNLFMAREWTTMAIFLVVSRNDTTVPLEELYHDMSLTAFLAGEMEIAVSYCEERIRLMPKCRSRHARKLLRHFRFELREESDQGEGWELPKKSRSKLRYDTLCQGRGEKIEDVTRKTAKSKLKCRYKKSKVPYYKYHLMKLEERSRDPYIVLYHDVFSEAELKTMRTLGMPKLGRALVVDDRTGKQIPSKDRVSQAMFLTYQQTFRETKHIVSRIAALTSLKMDLSSFESLQINNYGLGGMYDQHVDFYPKNYFKDPAKKNQRMATFMIYLSDVEAGGATVFPLIPDAVFPKAGNALFWYNTFRNGKEDIRTSHGGCPVIVGDKWVANEWIRGFGQEFSRPCARNENL